MAILVKVVATNFIFIFFHLWLLMGGTVIPVSSALGWDAEAGDDESKPS